MAEDTAKSGQQSSSQDRGTTTGTQQDQQARAGQAAGRDRRRIDV